MLPPQQYYKSTQWWVLRPLQTVAYVTALVIIHIKKRGWGGEGRESNSLWPLNSISSCLLVHTYIYNITVNYLLPHACPSHNNIPSHYLSAPSHRHFTSSRTHSEELEEDEAEGEGEGEDEGTASISGRNNLLTFEFWMCRTTWSPHVPVPSVLPPSVFTSVLSCEAGRRRPWGPHSNHSHCAVS